MAFEFRVGGGMGSWSMQTFWCSAVNGAGSQVLLSGLPDDQYPLTLTGCPFANSNTTSQQCQMDPILLTSLQTLTAIPVVGLVFQVTSFIWAVDDLAYFAYHKSTYDQPFRFASETSWSITNQKWAIPVL